MWPHPTAYGKDVKFSDHKKFRKERSVKIKGGRKEEVLDEEEEEEEEDGVMKKKATAV